MPRDWFWGDLPEGFKRVRLSRKRMIVVREGAEVFLNLEKLLADESAQREGSRFHGRERLAVLRMGNGGSALVRGYRHGGMLRRLTGGFFLTRPARPFRELAVTEEARRGGLPTVEILAASVERTCGPFYRGWLVTRELEGARDLWAAVQEEGLTTGSKKSLLETVARSIRFMHRRGIYHRDLNLKNILVRREADRFAGYIIDFDKAKLFPGEVPAAKAEKNLTRLLRSICKLDPERRRFSEADWNLFVGFYREAGAG